MPEPLPVVQTEDPLLSSGPDKVVMWSFPIIVDGLIYVVDLRNGLYILRYRGPHADEVARVKFLDGNSNTGDVQRMDPVAGARRLASRTPAGHRPGRRRPVAVPGHAAAPSRHATRAVQAAPARLATEVRGGPPTSVRRAGLSYCAEGGGKIGIAFRRSRIALLASSSRATVGLGRFRPGARAKFPRRVRKLRRGGLVMLRGRKYSTFARVKRGRVRVGGVVVGRPSAKALHSLVRGVGL